MNRYLILQSFCFILKSISELSVKCGSIYLRTCIERLMEYHRFIKMLPVLRNNCFNVFFTNNLSLFILIIHIPA